MPSPQELTTFAALFDALETALCQHSELLRQRGQAIAARDELRRQIDGELKDDDAHAQLLKQAVATARKREWPIWAMLVAWFPAILVLGGRMYIRPETLTLLYMAIFMAVLARIDRLPWLALFLPLVQVFWVNTQGLFVFGPIVLTMALIDAALRRSAFSKEQMKSASSVPDTAKSSMKAC